MNATQPATSFADDLTAQIVINYIYGEEIKPTEQERLLLADFVDVRYDRAITQFSENSDLLVTRVTKDNPYASMVEMSERVADTNQILVSDLYHDSTLWGAETNVKFRVSHDLLDHIKPQNDFSVGGERQAFINALKSFTEYLGRSEEYDRERLLSFLFCEFAAQPVVATYLGQYFDNGYVNRYFSQRCVMVKPTVIDAFVVS